MKTKERNNAKEHPLVAVKRLDREALGDKLWNTVVQAARQFAIGPHCVRSLRAWNAMGIERMELEDRSSPEDLAIAENNLKRFVQLMKREGVFIGHTEQLDNDCFHAAHRSLERSSIFPQSTLWPFWPNDLLGKN
jgi:hypothetical protein